ncbi:hypothetical protein CRUP_030764 [Coryphaenoides rupestris]|nr:hypothetical protein CRUP_030764 [Coryphaenoides rupestris]
MASRKTIHHPTICRTFPVPAQCETCCSLFHCPFCSPRFFKPTRQDKLMSHLSGHLKKAVVHGDFTIHRCGLQCRKGLHYHCLYCAGMLLRRDTFEHHLQHCKNTMTSGPTQPLTYGPTPSLTYGPTPSLTYGPTPPQAYVPAPPMPSVPAPPMPSGTTRKVHSNKMHITIQEGRCLPELKKCTTCCKDFHCPFCSAAVFHPAKWSKIRSHLESHFNRAVLHEGSLS